MIEKILETITAALVLLGLVLTTACIAMHAFNLTALVRAILANS